MTFTGALFVRVSSVFGALVVWFFLAWVVFFVVNNYLPPTHTSALTLFVLLIVVIVTGITASRFAQEVISRWVYSIIAASDITILILMIISFTDASNSYKIAGIAVGLLACLIL